MGLHDRDYYQKHVDKLNRSPSSGPPASPRSGPPDIDAFLKRYQAESRRAAGGTHWALIVVFWLFVVVVLLAAFKYFGKGV